MRVVVTRPAGQAGKWVNGLRAAGLNALSMPLIEIGAVPDVQGLAQAWMALSGYDAVMFVSANAVDGFFDARPGEAGGWPQIGAVRPRVWVTGPASVAALLRQGVPVDAIDAPSESDGQYDSEALWQRVQRQVHPGFRCLIVRGTIEATATDVSALGSAAADTDAMDHSDADTLAAFAPAEPLPDAPPGHGRDWLADTLRASGARVDFVVAYVRRLPSLSFNAVALIQVASSDGTVWLFTSSEAIENLRTLVPAQRWGQARAVVTHARIAQAAREAGFGVVCESRPSLDALVASIESLQ